MAKSKTSQPSWIVKTLSQLIRSYQTISPFFGPRCRFTPSCSEYLREALAMAGFWKGLFQGTRRLLKCHPWHPGGFDPYGI